MIVKITNALKDYESRPYEQIEFDYIEYTREKILEFVKKHTYYTQTLQTLDNQELELFLSGKIKYLEGDHTDYFYIQTKEDIIKEFTDEYEAMIKYLDEVFKE